MLSDILKSAGFTVSEDTDKFAPYEKFSDERFPFGSTVPQDDKEDSYSDLYKDSLRGINFLREHKTPFALSDYLVITKNPVYEWLLENEDKCFVVNKGTVHEKPANGNLGLTDSFLGNEYEVDCPYGTVDMIFSIVYSEQYQMFTFNVNSSAFNGGIPEQKAFRERYRRECDSEDFNAFEWFKENIFPLSEFIPVEIHPLNKIRISHKEYRDRIFGHVDAVTEPYLGKSVKADKNIMDGLTEWLASGGYIKDDSFYLVINDRRSKDPKHACYLRPWNKEVEEKKKKYVTGW